VKFAWQWIFSSSHELVIFFYFIFVNEIYFFTQFRFIASSALLLLLLPRQSGGKNTKKHKQWRARRQRRRRRLQRYEWLRVRAGCQVARFTFLIISWFSFFARCDYENGVKRGGRLQIELCFVAGIIALLSHADVTSSPILLKIEYIFRYISFFQLVNSHFWEFFWSYYFSARFSKTKSKSKRVGGYVFDGFLWPSTETGRRTLKLTIAWNAPQSPKPIQSWLPERDGTIGGPRAELWGQNRTARSAVAISQKPWKLPQRKRKHKTLAFFVP